MTSREEYYILGNIVEAVRLLEESTAFAAIVPEVRSNLVMALPDAAGPEQVAGVPGRITVVFGKPKAVSYPAFGASRYVSRLLLAIMKREPSRRAAIEIKYSPELVALAQRMGWAIASADPEDQSAVGWDLDAAVRRAQESYGRFPEAIYSKGGFAREGAIALLGESAVEVVQRALAIAQEFASSAGRAG